MAVARARAVLRSEVSAGADLFSSAPRPATDLWRVCGRSKCVRRGEGKGGERDAP